MNNANFRVEQFLEKIEKNQNLLESKFNNKIKIISIGIETTTRSLKHSTDLHLFRDRNHDKEI